MVSYGFPIGSAGSALGHFGGGQIGDFVQDSQQQAQTESRSLVLQALEQQYRNAMSDSSQSAEARARSAGTWANTPEFAQGLQDEAGLQAQGSQAALLPRINALRTAAGMQPFDPSSNRDTSGAGSIPTNFLNSAWMANVPQETRAEIMRELEAAYSGMGGEVANSFAQSSGLDLSNPDNVRLLQSQTASGTTGANNALTARLNALRSSLNLENFSSPTTPGQLYTQAGQNAQSAATNSLASQNGSSATAPAAAPTSAPKSEDAAENVAEDNAANAEPEAQQNAVTAAAAPRKRATPKVL